MLYYLFEYLEKQYQFPGASLFGFITFSYCSFFINICVLRKKNYWDASQKSNGRNHP